ncbi:Diaminopimelate epimerase-like protein [Whalleya microplaca]|nr:Diaminopimelate epimerase-like protein [Whalleya microplaca]
MELQFTTLDVFTSTRLQGNPLAVVTVPAAQKDVLSQAAKQKIAQEFNLSETVFLHEAPDPQSTQRHIDIFTIESQIPYAGHPTIGTAVLVRQHLRLQHVDTLVAGAGAIGLVPSGSQIRAKIPHDVRLHARTLAYVLGDGQPLEGLSPDPEVREAELRAPVVSVVRGMTFVLVKLASLEALARVRMLRLDFDALPAPLLDEGWRGSFVCRYYYVDVEGEGDGVRSVRSRMVEMGAEDPATGSAATALGAFLTLTEEKRGTRLRVTQGVEMGRKSDISVETTTKEAEGGVELAELWLGGTAVVVMKGSLTVDV